MICILCKKQSPFLYRFPFISLYRCPECSLISAGKNKHPLRTLDWGQENKEIDDYYLYQFCEKDKYSIQLLQKNGLISPGKVLDIGCATGSFLAAMQERGWYVRGAEPSPSLCKIAREKYGFELVQAEFDPKYFDHNFDLVTFFDVLEHTINPKTFLEQVLKVVKPGGYLFCKVPNWNSITVQLCVLIYTISFGKILMPIKMVTQVEYNYHHRFYFSKKSLERLFQFKKLELVYCSTETTILHSTFFQRHEFQKLSPFFILFAKHFLRLLQYFEGLLDRRDTLTILVQIPNNK